ncbi:RNA pseudouridine synthase 7 [Zea mays]|uniref:RNA pseudouridine synthase 7 n=1 Tax=Zea mays TaxID=4577 RepID=A0A1D6H940_MAIZE|nr:RNA pseudouridine synthase 7 [Zea mays]
MAAPPGGAGIVWQTPANPPESHDYIIRNGRRYVRPYYFEFISHVKNRWAGKTIVDLFTDEFKGRSRDYYVHAVKCGRLQVDGQMVHTDYIVKSSQKISHFLHSSSLFLKVFFSSRHEPPVLAGDISILKNEVDVVTICKPASVPVAVHRLDRLVSGLLIFAKNADRAECFRQQIEAGLLQKEYVAKVVGVFPDGEHGYLSDRVSFQQTVDANVNFNAREGRSTVEIRVHLKQAGYPIANDELYLSGNFCPRSTKGTNASKKIAPSDPDSSAADHGSKDAGTDVEFDIDPMCTNCPNLAPVGYDRDEEGLWLHCVRYTGPDWSYECPYPDWAFLGSVSTKKMKS